MKHNEDNFNDEPNLPLDPNGKSPFGLPLDYFASFEDKLKKKLEQENELSEFPVLSSLKRINVFTVPENYFNSVKHAVEYKTELTAYPKLESVKLPVYSELDEEYKKQLHASLNYRIQLANELKPYASLYLIDKVNTFAVPEFYFESVAERVKESVHAVKESKPSVLHTVLDFIFGKKLAFAFGFIFIIALSVYFNRASSTSDEPGDCKTLACLEKQEILNNKAISNFDEEQLMDMVDVNSLGKQLNLKEHKTDSLSIKKENILENTTTDELLDEL